MELIGEVITTEVVINTLAHAKTYFAELRFLLDMQQLCDLTIKAGISEFKVHKLVLVASSPYFRTMFTTEFFKESNTDFVELHNIDPGPFSTILKYFYSGCVILSTDTVEGILKTADFLSVSALRRICIDYVMKITDKNNCIQMFCLADELNLEEVKDTAVKVILDEIDFVSTTEDFLKLDRSYLIDIIKKGNLAHAESFYKAVIQWVKYDLDSRKSCLLKHLETIPVEGIHRPFYLAHILPEPILRQDVECMKWVIDNFIDKFHNRPYSWINCRSVFITNRAFKTSSCLTFNIVNKMSSKMPEKPAVEYFSPVSHSGNIFLLGGKVNEYNIQHSFKLSEDTRRWTKLNCNFNRTDSGACLLNDKVYLIGGFDCNNDCRLKSCILFDPSTGQKMYIAQLNEEKELPGVAAEGNSVYACCGSGGKCNKSPIDRYDPREGIWNRIGKYNAAIGICSSTIVSNGLYTCGLDNGIFSRFDIRNGQSLRLPQPSEGSLHFITSLNNKVYGSVKEKGIFIFDDTTNAWEPTECKFDLSCPIIVPW